MATGPRRPTGQPGLSYTLIEPLRDDEACFVFDGPFEGETITWNARLVTLERANQLDLGGSGPPFRRPFIDIDDSTPSGHRLTVALDIPRIDEPTVLRTIIMIRQYKRLRRGRHEFGEARHPGTTY